MKISCCKKNLNEQIIILISFAIIDKKKRYAMKTYSNLYGNNMALFFFQYEIDFFYPYFQEIFFILELN
jgi:hypothetical protein